MIDSQAEYYKNENFNPTAFDISEDATYQEHRLKRLNLYTNKLKIPQGYWAGKSVLEVGCSSGENALVLAELGANFTFIDPMAVSLERLQSLFTERGYERQIIDIKQAEIQNVELGQEKYDFVIAEGFLYTLRERKRVLNNFFTALKPWGLLSLSTLDPVGNFVEFFKKTLFIYFCRQSAAEALNSQLSVAWELFGEDYVAIPHSRPFDSWIRDNFLNPTYELKSMWGIREILSDSLDIQPRVYSSWPRLEPANDVTWYKKVDSYQEEKDKVLNAYQMRLPSYVHGKNLPDGCPLMNLSVAQRFEATVHMCMNEMQLYIDNMENGLSSLSDAIQQIEQTSDGLYDEAIIATVMEDALNILNAPTVEAYKKAVNLRNCWGVGYPYYVLQKNDSKTYF